MQATLRPTSLSKDFIVFSAVILLAALVISGGYGWHHYQNELDKKAHQAEIDATRITALLADYMDHVSQYAGFLGARIVDASAKLPSVAALIGCHEREKFNFMTTFDWVTPDKRLRASSCVGVVERPLDMSDRDYLARTAKAPWKLQLSAPRYGGMSKRWIVPAGMGVTASNGKFLGSITTGFSISELNQRLTHLLGREEGPRFLILTPEGQLVLDSQRDNSLPPEQPMPFATGDSAQPGKLNEPLIYDDYRFTHQAIVPNYPFRVLTGFSSSMPMQLFSTAVLPGLLLLLISASVAALLIYYLRRRFIRPVLHLSQQANRIANGESITIESTHVVELAALEDQVQRISNYLVNEKHTSSLLTQETKSLRKKTTALLHANDDVRHERDAAIQADQAKSEFLANMSHEIRTPLNAVIGLTSILLMQRHPPQRQKEFLETIQLSAKQLLRLINDVLDLSRLENRQLTLEKTTFDLPELIGEVMAINQVTAHSKQINLAFGRTVSIPMLKGDPLRIRQIIMNLIGNAVKFTDRGGVTVHFDCHMPFEERSPAQVTIAVEDTGMGIPADKLEEIFGKFSQADASVSRKHGGSGLGLSISKNLAELMGGSITVASMPGKGSVFTLKLPLAQVADDALLASAPTLSDTHGLEALRVLVVEDNPGNILVVSTLLETLGCQFDVASSGEEALRRLENPDYHAVLMDIQMPELDGYQVTRRLRELEREQGRRHLYVIGLTAHSLLGDREKGMAAGMDYYLPKPFEPDELIAMLKTCYAKCPRVA